MAKVKSIKPVTTLQNASLVAAVAQIKAEVTRLEGDTIAARYAIGAKILAIVNNPAEYGTGAMAYIRSQFPGEASYIGSLIEVARRFSKKDLDALTALKDPSGRPAMSWSHIRSLVLVPTNKPMFALAREAAATALPVFGLRRRIKNVVPPTRNHTPRSKPRVLTFENMLSVVIEKCTSVVDMSDRTWSHPDHGLEALAANRSDETKPTVGWDDATEVDRAIATVSAAQKRLTKILVSLRRIDSKIARDSAAS